MNENTIHVAIAENTTEKVVNSYGKKVKYHNGGYRVALLLNEEAYQATIRKATNSYSAECWAILRAVELAHFKKLTSITISKRGHASWIAGGDAINQYYLDLALAKATILGIEVEFDHEDQGNNPAASIAKKGSAPWLPKREETGKEKRLIYLYMQSLKNERGTHNARKKEKPGLLSLPSSVNIPSDLKDE